MTAIPERGRHTGVVAVVVTRNRPELLRMSLAALKSQSIPLQTIVVVDNASERETVRLLEGERELHILRLERNTGGSGGFAAGVEKALKMRPDWIWLLDDDVIVNGTTLEHLLCNTGESGNEAKGFAVLCPAVLERGRLALMHRRYFDPLTLHEITVPREKYRCSVVEIDTASFVGFLVRADAVRRVGLPDARFFLSYDDTEFSLRLRSAGYRLGLIPASRVDHRRAADGLLRRGPYGLKHYYNLRNRLIVYHKFGCAPAWQWLFPLAQSFMLLLVAGRGRPTSFKWWWKAVRDGNRSEPFVLDQTAPRKPASAPGEKNKGD